MSKIRHKIYNDDLLDYIKQLYRNQINQTYPQTPKIVYENILEQLNEIDQNIDSDPNMLILSSDTSIYCYNHLTQQQQGMQYLILTINEIKMQLRDSSNSKLKHIQYVLCLSRQQTDNNLIFPLAICLTETINQQSISIFVNQTRKFIENSIPNFNFNPQLILTNVINQDILLDFSHSFNNKDLKFLLCKSKLRKILKTHIKDKELFPYERNQQLNIKETKKERKARLKILMNDISNLGIIYDKQISESYWRFIKNINLLKYGKFIGQFEKDYINSNLIYAQGCYRKIGVPGQINNTLISDLTCQDLKEGLISLMKKFDTIKLINEEDNLNPEIMNLIKYDIEAKNYCQNQEFETFQQYLISSAIKRQIKEDKSQLLNINLSKSRQLIGKIYFKETDKILKFYDENFNFKLTNIEPTLDCYFLMPQAREINLISELQEQHTTTLLVKKLSGDLNFQQSVFDNLNSLINYRILSIYEIGGENSGKYDFQCNCDDFYVKQSECLHKILIQINLGRVSEIQCIDEIGNNSKSCTSINSSGLKQNNNDIKSKDQKKSKQKKKSKLQKKRDKKSKKKDKKLKDKTKNY